MDSVGVCTGGGGAGLSGGKSMLCTDDIRIGFGGGLLKVFCFSVGGCGGAYLGRSGTTVANGLEISTGDEPFDPVDGGLGGELGGGIKKAKSSSCLKTNREGGFGALMGGG